MLTRCGERFEDRHDDLNRTAGMVLDPLTKVGIRMLVTILVRGAQLVVNLQRRRKGRQGQENQDHCQGYRSSSRRPFGGSSSWQMEHGVGL